MKYEKNNSKIKKIKQNENNEKDIPVYNSIIRHGGFPGM
jgi:hypothetical protein